MNKFSLFFVCGGTVALALSLVMGWVGVPLMIRGQIQKNARLVKGRDAFEIWKGTSSVSTHVKFFIFNITNPDEVETGGKPALSEIGPYTYLEKRLKVDIGPGERNHTIQYRRKHLLYFLPQLSTGSEQDLINIINIPLLITVKFSSQFEPESIKAEINSKLAELKESVITTGTIREILFEGISVDTFVDLLEAHQESNDTKLPEQFVDRKYALYQGRNGTDGCSYEVNTGEFNYKDFGQIKARNNETLLPWWKDETCNDFNGTTDGTIFAPFLTRLSKLKIYSAELCRTQDLIYVNDTEFKGVSTYRFKPDIKFVSSQNPENRCYCAYTIDSQPCEERDGIFSTAACTDGAPFSMSYPHFYGNNGGDESSSLLSNVNGLEPVEERHETFLDIEPTTAKVLKATRRLQMNVDVGQVPQLPMLGKLKTMTIPIAWTEEYTELTDEYLKFFGQIKSISEFVNESKYFFIIGSLITVGIGVIVGMLRRDKIEHQLIK